MDKSLVSDLIHGIVKIDDSCRGLLNGMEQGLVHVKNEFYDEAFVVLGKKMTEETIIAWKLRDYLQQLGYAVKGECRYPNQQSTMWCDIVIDPQDGHASWIEAKLAWKAWFNCQDGPVYSNRSYRPYLLGINKTHSFRHDLERLSTRCLPDTTERIVCLIGFDHCDSPMWSEVKSVVDEQARSGNIWNLCGEYHWDDKRNQKFRFHIWCWKWQA